MSFNSPSPVPYKVVLDGAPHSGRSAILHRLIHEKFQTDDDGQSTSVSGVLDSAISGRGAPLSALSY